MFRRIKSCPADLCNMVNRKKRKKTETANILPLFVVPNKAYKIIKKGDCVDEIVTSSLLDANVHDPTEQLVFLMILRKLLSRTKTNLSGIFYEICIRSAISFTTHKIMETMFLHVHVYLISK